VFGFALSVAARILSVSREVIRPDPFDIEVIKIEDGNICLDVKRTRLDCPNCSDGVSRTCPLRHCVSNVLVASNSIPV